MRIKCPKCHKMLKVADNLAGKRGKCLGSGQVLGEVTRRRPEWAYHGLRTN